MESLFPHGITHYLAGGLFIGAGVALLYLATGLVGGMSSVYSTTLSWVSRARHFHQERFLASRHWRVAYAGGLVLGALACSVLIGPTPITSVPPWTLVLGGFVAGFGARLSNGCTSGHGICGMASLQWPSMAAVGIFLATAMLTAHLVRAFGGLA
jgi:uncharacterized membrane protein YedE/YeeE